MSRISESELLLVESAGDVYIGGGQLPTGSRSLVAEIRRYRALLLALAPLHQGPPNAPPAPVCPIDREEACWWCRTWGAMQHVEGCPWPALKAEVQAIREELVR